MTRYPEMERLCHLLAGRDTVNPLGVLAAADQLEALHVEHPGVVTRAHALFGAAAARWAHDPCEATESRLVVAHKAAVRITQAAGALPD